MSDQSVPRKPTTLKPGDPFTMRVKDLADLLSRVSGESVTPRDIRRDIASGAPSSRRGNTVVVNLLHYGAWLVSEWDVSRRSPRQGRGL